MMSGFSFRPSKPSQRFLRPNKCQSKPSVMHFDDQAINQSIIAENLHLRQELDALSQLLENRTAELTETRQCERQLAFELATQRDQLAQARTLIEQSNSQLITQSMQLNDSRSELQKLRQTMEESLSQSNAQSVTDQAAIERLLTIKSQRDRQVASLILERNKLQAMIDQSASSLQNASKCSKHSDIEESNSAAIGSAVKTSAKKVATPRTPSQRDSLDYDFEQTMSQRRSSNGGTVLRLKKTITLLEEKVAQLQANNQTITQANLDLTVRFKNATDARNRAEKKITQLNNQLNNASPKSQTDENYEQTNVVVTRVSPKALTPRVEGRGQRWTK